MSGINISLDRTGLKLTMLEQQGITHTSLVNINNRNEKQKVKNGGQYSTNQALMLTHTVLSKCVRKDK